MKWRYTKFVVFAITLLFSLLITSLMISWFRDEGKRASVELIQAAWDGDVDKMKALIEAGADVNFDKTAHPSCIPLTCASKQGHIQAVRILLDSGADINATDDSHMTALMWASEGGHVDVAQLLLSAGADVNLSFHGRTALQLATGSGRKEIIELLKRKDAKK